MKKILFSFFLLSNFLAQGQGANEFYFLRIDDETIPFDTAIWKMIGNENLKSSFMCEYLVDETGDTTKFILPKGTEYNDPTRLTDSIEVKIDENFYSIFKYQMDEPSIMDEELQIFYSPTYGILSIRAKVWRNYTRIIETNSSEDTHVIFYLTEQIISNESFFNGWKD